MKFVFEMTKEKTTTGTFRMKAIEEEQVSDTIYLKKRILEAAGIKDPGLIRVTIEIDV